MSRIKFLRKELQEVRSVLDLVESYEEISAMRMRKVKGFVLNNREFMSGLNNAFAYISYAYREYKIATKDKSAGVLNTNGKTVHVLLSSNVGLFGDIIRDTFMLFAEEIEKVPNDDVVVVGKVGKGYFEDLYPERKFSYFDYPDSGVDPVASAALLKNILPYSDIVVYHGVFKSIVSQEPSRTLMTGEVLKIESELRDKGVRFIFEPSIDKLAEYFEKQILSVIFEQSIYESSLSKFASRMVSLDKASENVRGRKYRIKFSLNKLKHRNINTRMQSGIWSSTKI